MLKAVHIPRAETRLDDYPHQFSGGMRQRVMIAMALINNPDLLIADEPTTALDVTTQAQILKLMNELQRDFGSAIILVTHDLGVVAETADHVLVMYAAKAAEEGPYDDIFYRPQHPYTWGLLGSLPRLVAEGAELTPIPGSPPSLLRPPSGCRFHLRCTFAMEHCSVEVPELLRDGRAPSTESPATSTHTSASLESDDLCTTDGGAGLNGLDGRTTAGGREPQEVLPDHPRVIFQKEIGARAGGGWSLLLVNRGETLGVVGESGCGKSTMARCVMRLLDPTDGRSCSTARTSQARRARSDGRAGGHDDGVPGPVRVAHSRKRVGAIVGEALEVHGRRRRPRSDQASRSCWMCPTPARPSAWTSSTIRARTPGSVSGSTDAEVEDVPGAPARARRRGSSAAATATPARRTAGVEVALQGGPSPTRRRLSSGTRQSTPTT